MRLPKKHAYRIPVILTFIALPFCIIAVIILYLKLAGFKHALEDLVYSRTNGAYTLHVGSTEVDLTQSRFELKRISISKTTPNADNPIERVDIPNIKLQLGSLKSALFDRQLQIKQLIIAEPIVKFNPSTKRRTPHSRDNLAQNVLKLYPPVESLLSNFNIETLLIQRAGVHVGIDDSPGESIKLGLINFLVAHWNIRQLSGTSNLNLKIGGQKIAFGKALLGFSGVEFDFKSHVLRFNDFEYTTSDSVSQTEVTATLKTLSLHALDYKELYENQRYKIHDVKIDQPELTATLVITKDKSKKIPEADIITALINQTIGECKVDTTIINDAKLNLRLFHGSDSTNISLANIDIGLSDFEVMKDSRTFQVGELQAELREPVVSLRKDLTIKCGRIVFDRNRDLTLYDIEMFDPSNKTLPTHSEKTRVRNFNLPAFVFYKQIYADDITVENGTISITQKSSAGRRFKKLDSSQWGDVSIQNLNLTNVTFHYTGSATIVLSGVFAQVNGIVYDSSRYDFTTKEIRMKKASYSNPNIGTTGNIQQVTYDGRKLAIEALQFRKGALMIRANKFHAIRDSSIAIHKAYKKWEHVMLDDIEFNGKISMAKSAQAEVNRSNKFPQIFIDTLNINTVKADVQFADNHISFEGHSIGTSNIALDSDTISHDQIEGTITNAGFKTPSINAMAERISLHYPELISLREFRIQKGNISSSVRNFDLQSISRTRGSINVAKAGLHQIQLEQDNVPMFSCDSTTMSDLQWIRDSVPMLDQITVYKPLMILPTSRVVNKNDPANYSTGGIDITFVNHITIHPGTIRTAKNKDVEFGRISLDTKANTAQCEQIRFDSEKLNFALSNLILDHRNISIDSIHVANTEAWKKSHSFEESEIDATFRGLTFENTSVLDFLRQGTMKDGVVTIGNASLAVRQDKRYPDPPYKEKPPNLSVLLNFPQSFQPKILKVLDGEIQYTEISEKTGLEGTVFLGRVSADISFERNNTPLSFVSVNAKARLYDEGTVDLKYETLDTSSFALKVDVENLDLKKLNTMTLPLQALEVKSGQLINYSLDIVANREDASGTAVLSYDDLHLRIHKATDPGSQSLGTDLLTLLADGIILKHSKKNASSSVHQIRIKNKSVFNYWVKSAINGAMSSVRKGKSRKNNDDELLSKETSNKKP